MTLIASIITFSKKKNFGKKKMLPLTLDMEPSTLDPRRKDRLVNLTGLVQGIEVLRAGAN